ncbi:hypothetical protein CK203_059133 [Vitis vinifera]|uniref:Uncharacterized protein n=1 Tax=Vitis vinifera TaxID=29760 RepID=A0A438GCF3_VITVI|nr:hypothetical protein CK203_059133 [Vitis vinifera]
MSSSGGEFMVTVRRKEVVATMLPMQKHWLPLSNLDLLLPPINVGVFFCYKKPRGSASGGDDFTFGSMVRVLKEAMAQALVPYYAFAGEVLSNSLGEAELLCNNRGVDFLEAYADVTELKCGGIVVACTFDHRIADAYSTNMFLVSWAEMAQSKPLSVIPSFRRSLLNPRRPGSYAPSLDQMYVPISALPPPKVPQPGADPLS